MMKYRNRFAIASKILQVARAGNATKTRLMYGSFLSFAQINEYLSFLMTNALIMRDEVSQTYALTRERRALPPHVRGAQQADPARGNDAGSASQTVKSGP
jgi:predicted transcriptional regulator